MPGVGLGAVGTMLTPETCPMVPRCDLCLLELSQLELSFNRYPIIILGQFRLIEIETNLVSKQRGR